MEQRAELERFLAGAERRAFAHANFALRNRDDSLDAIQDAMMKLAMHYADRPPDEWPGLFHRILENRICDVQRHRTVRARVLHLWPGRRAGDDADTDDLVANASDTAAAAPDRAAGNDAAMAALYGALSGLPRRQREAFVLRTLHGLSVEQTSRAMAVSAGSVKTHLSRAMAKLRTQLGEFDRNGADVT
ncbi:MAG: RNA polymerase sigma factor [Pseudomonadota bacterium]